MTKTTILLFSSMLLSTSLFSDNLKIKTYEHSNSTYVKLLIPSSLYEKYGESNYIKNFNIKVDNTNILNLYMSKYFVRNPIIKFNYKNINPNNEITLSLNVSENKYIDISKKIKHTKHEFKLKNLSIEESKKNSKKLKISNDIFKEKSINNVLNNLYGTDKTTTINSIIDVPKEVLGDTLININTKRGFESIVVFRTDDDYVTKAIFELSPNIILDINFKLEIQYLDKEKNINIIVVAKGIDGKLYKSSESIKVIRCIADCNGGGG